MEPDNEPTILSLQDTVNVFKNKFGDDWSRFPICKMVVIWASSSYIESDVKKTVPDLFTLCKEYRNTGKVNGKEMSPNISMAAFYLLDTYCTKEDLERLSEGN